MSSQQDFSSSERIRVPYHEEVAFQIPDASTPAGQSILRSLRTAQFIWLTTVDAEHVPHSLPLGFLWDEAQSTFLIYSMSAEDREHVKHIQQNSKVGLHLEMSSKESLVVLTGEASVNTDDPSSNQVPAWVEKYQATFAQMGMTMQQAALAAPVALRIRPLTMIVTSWIER